MAGGRFATVWAFNASPLDRIAEPDNFFGGFSLEGLATRALFRHFGIKVGLTYDFDFDGNNLQPVVLAAVRF
jgi:hypothetical protein